MLGNIFKNLKKRLLCVLTMLAAAGVTYASTATTAFCTTTSIADSITEYIPLFISFAILGALMGMLKKFGKW